MQVRLFRRRADEDVIVSVSDSTQTSSVHCTASDLRQLVSACDHFLSKEYDAQLREFPTLGVIDMDRKFENG